MDSKLQRLADASMSVPGQALKKAKAEAPPRPKRQRIAAEVTSLPKLTTQQLRERAAKLLDEKRETLLQHYAKTDLPPERVAEHVGITKQVDTGKKWSDGNPVMQTVPDVERVAARLEWIRSHGG